MSETKTLVASANKVQFNIDLKSIEEVKNFCAVLAKSDMVPKGYKDKPDSIMVAGIMGQEIGLPLMQALQSIAVINGIPSIYGDAALALVRSSGQLEDFDEWFELNGEKLTGSIDWDKHYAAKENVLGVCESKRVGYSKPRRTVFGIADAVAAGLWGKMGPWKAHTSRMMMFRPRGYNLRDQFGDILKGLKFYEEAIDMEQTSEGTFAPVDDKKPTTLGALLKDKKEQSSGLTVNVATTLAPAEITQGDPSKEVADSQFQEVQEAAKTETQPETQTKPASAPEADQAAGVLDTPEGKEAVENVHKLTALIKEFNATAKGRALLAGHKKTFKLGAADVWPDDQKDFVLFLQGLTELKKKL